MTGGAVESTLRVRRDAGRKLLVPYVTGGVVDGWTDLLAAYRDAGADAVEIGLPFSDPMLDGPTIQQASDRALARGSTAAGILAEVASTAHRGLPPLIVMTYANLVARTGPVRFCRALADAGVAGLVVPDLPLDELEELPAAARDAGVDLVLLAAPGTAGRRLRQICEHSRGFVYAVSVLGTTGARAGLATSATALAARVKAVTDRPVLIGFGIAGPAAAAAAARAGDGVVIASALMRRVLDGATPDEVGRDVAAVRAELDRESDGRTGTAAAEVPLDRG